MSLPHFFLFQSCLLLPSCLFGYSLLLLDLVPLISELMHCNFIEILFISLCTGVARSSKSSVDTRRSSISSVVTMSNARNRSDSDILVDKVLSCEIVKCFSEVWLLTDALSGLTLLKNS